MAALDPDLTRRIHERLDEVKDPCSVTAGENLGLAEMGLVKSVDVSGDGEVSVVLRLTSPFGEMIGYLTSEAIEKIAALPSVRSVDVRTDSGFDWSPEDMAPHVQRRREERLAAQRADVLRRHEAERSCPAEGEIRRHEAERSCRAEGEIRRHEAERSCRAEGEIQRHALPLTPFTRAG